MSDKKPLEKTYTVKPSAFAGVMLDLRALELGVPVEDSIAIVGTGVEDHKVDPAALVDEALKDQ